MKTYCLGVLLHQPSCPSTTTAIIFCQTSDKVGMTASYRTGLGVEYGDAHILLSQATPMTAGRTQETC
jgi:hypothetical protein